MAENNSDKKYEAARKRVEERYTRTLFADRAESFYRRLIAGKGAAGE